MKSFGQRTWLLKCTEGKRAQGRPSDEPWEPMWCSEDFVKTYGEAAELIVVEGENHRLSKKTRKVAELVVAFFDAM